MPCLWRWGLLFVLKLFYLNGKIMNAEVIIIGAGPAGLCTALELALLNIPVIICERASFPIDKPCGEGIMPEGASHLERLGVMKHLEQTNFSYFAGVALINQQGERAFSKFAHGTGIGVRRLALSQALYERVLCEPNIKLLSQRRVMSIEHHAHSLKVLTDQDILTTRLVIGADGLRSQVRKWAKLDSKERNFRRYGMRRHFLIKPWSNHVEVYFSHGLEAYVTPCGTKQTNVTFLWDKDLISEPLFSNFLECFPVLKQRLAGAYFISEERVTGPLEHRCSSPIAHGIALVGDACGYFDAITGEGNSIAMSCAHALARTVHKALSLSKNIITKNSLENYFYDYKKIVKKYYRNTRIMLYTARRINLINKLISFGSKNPRIFSWAINTMRAPSKINF